MNNWLKIGVPVLIAALLITASVGVTLGLTGKGAVGQSDVPAVTPGQETGIQYARGARCSDCSGTCPGVTAGDRDDSTGGVYVPKGANCPNCPGYTADAGAQPATTVRGGRCSGR